MGTPKLHVDPSWLDDPHLEVATICLSGALNTLEQACDTFDYDAVKTFIEGLVEGASLETQLGDLTPRADVVPLSSAKTD